MDESTDEMQSVVESERRRGMRMLAEEIEPILSLLHHRGLVDSEHNRQDVSNALRLVRNAIESERR